MAFTPKYVQSRPVARLGEWRLKPYHVLRDAGRPLDPALAAAAHETAATLLPEGEDGTPRAGWLVLHQGRDALYLCVYTWVWDNVVHVRTASAGEEHLGGTAGDLTRWTVNTTPYAGCVWELPTMDHERRAWVRHLLRPEIPDVAAYLDDRLADGPIGE